jgi:hypothetical protein
MAFGEFGSAGGHKNMARAEIELSALDPRIIRKPALLNNFVIRRLWEALSRKRQPESGASGERKRQAGHTGGPHHQSRPG